MGEWCLKERDLKRYPHFDSFISAKDAMVLALDPRRVATHTFYPFMRYTQHWTRFAKEGKQGKVKERPIRYAARRDAYIFARYRHLLSELYETELIKSGLSDCVLAYRTIKNKTGRGKCNIDFAKDAFLKIKEIGNCSVLALDISSYFEKVDHDKLKSLWCRLIRETQLPPDHFRVFKAITRYSVVDKKDVYERLGHYGKKRISTSGNPINGYLTAYKDTPRWLCCGREFREKIAGGNGQKSLIQVNFKPHGIPQGAPISDLLANLYLFDFDSIVNEKVSSIGGAYYRYSDDILIVIPGDGLNWEKWREEIGGLIKNYGRKLEIKKEKSVVFVFTKNRDDTQKFNRVYGENGQGKNGLEYLGFRYDGRKVFLRDSTLSSLQRKIVYAARHNVNYHVAQNPEKSIDELKATFRYGQLISRFGRVRDFKRRGKNFQGWTFWTYAHKASTTFSSLGTPILHQLRRHKSQIHQRVGSEIDRTLNQKTKPT